MAKKNIPRELIKCGNCIHAGPIKGLSVWCKLINTGRVANSLRYCINYKYKA